MWQVVEVIISTHTLTWSVTVCEQEIKGYFKISTHTLTWSVTRSKIVPITPVYFNSHAHVERDYSGFATGTNYQISTHTLTWSVTFTVEIIITSVFISTHTLTWSVTYTSAVFTNLDRFQLTRSRGA